MMRRLGRGGWRRSCRNSLMRKGGEMGWAGVTSLEDLSGGSLLGLIRPL